MAIQQPAVARTSINLRASLQEHEARLIRQALRASGGNQRRAAELLELPLRTFERKLRSLNLRQRARLAAGSDQTPRIAPSPCATLGNDAQRSVRVRAPYQVIRGAISSETTAITLMRMATPGPEVSLNGSPTVSPTTAAL
jgi:hypothetical protein